MAGRRSVLEAGNTRQSILNCAADMASVEGLEGITVGRLATALNMSKAGVIGHFGNKLELQLATLDFAAEVFRREVWQPAEHETAGIRRLLAICASWMEYAGRPAFPGGCFIAAASFEFDSRPGPVHDALAAHMRRWHTQLVADAEAAVAAGDLPANTDVEQLAFDLEALAARVSPNRQLYGDEGAAEHARVSMLGLLGRKK
ncbi:TetR/AcrR family transcriptional regulator [Mycobacterium sp. 2YAF39]|uniref:TetR/AcrR family transcriptional regulator n=1 Tax=Mycobacterium sp. 2YAF39 TaxID=3233033 RepID=UPI003F9B1D57